jgi:protein-S-isoprenylcysteine O-methyltransferase Ste14
MTVSLAKIIWMLGYVAWMAIRWPHQRRSRQTPVAERRERTRDMVLMTCSTAGLGIFPISYVAIHAFRFADYPFRPWQAWLGTAVLIAAMVLFRRTHSDLGRSWSVTLEVRERHRLITHGIYERLRHPMYAAFWLWAVAQALLLPNWVAGFAGIVGFGTLFFGRVGYEERMMLDKFGDEYRAYMGRTKRVVPGIY